MPFPEETWVTREEEEVQDCITPLIDKNVTALVRFPILYRLLPLKTRRGSHSPTSGRNYWAHKSTLTPSLESPEIPFWFTECNNRFFSTYVLHHKWWGTPHECHRKWFPQRFCRPWRPKTTNDQQGLYPDCSRGAEDKVSHCWETHNKLCGPTGDPWEETNPGRMMGTGLLIMGDKLPMKVLNGMPDRIIVVETYKKKSLNEHLMNSISLQEGPDSHNRN